MNLRYDIQLPSRHWGRGVEAAVESMAAGWQSE